MLKSFSRIFNFYRNNTCRFRNKMECIPTRLTSVNVSPYTSPVKDVFSGITPKKDNHRTDLTRPFRVSVEGNIGAGKTTFIEFLRGIPDLETNSEPIDWWQNVNGYNLFELMYNDMEKWLGVFQSYVLLTRLNIQTKTPKNFGINTVVYERSVQNNRFCFLEMALSTGKLSTADYNVLDQWYRFIVQQWDVDLDLIVYLRTSPKIVYDRVKKRGRSEEAPITLEYLENLHECHEKWLMHKNERFNTVPVLVLDADGTIASLKTQFQEKKNQILGHKNPDGIPVRNVTKKLIFNE